MTFNVMVVILATVIRQVQEKKAARWERSKTTSICKWHNLLYKNSKEFKEKIQLLGLINEFLEKLQNARLIYKNQLYFYNLIDNLKMILRK